MKFRIDPVIFEKYPGTHIGVIVVKGIDNTKSSDAVIERIRAKEKEIRETFDAGTLSQHPKIEAWRKAYSAFGAKPKKYKCSVENLYRMILDDIALKSINTVVDVYNLISISHIVPVGGDDLDKVDGDITLTIAKGDEQFIALNSDEVKHPKEGEVVYRDDKEVLCRRWNWRECEKSKMTQQTMNVALVVEGLAPISKDELESITTELRDLVTDFCGGEATLYVLDNNNVEIEISL